LLVCLLVCLLACLFACLFACLLACLLVCLFACLFIYLFVSSCNCISDDDMKDGERLTLAIKDMGSCEIFPQTLCHNPNGRFVVVCGDGEYIIYTAMALRNKSFGSAQEFVWASDSSE